MPNLRGTVVEVNREQREALVRIDDPPPMGFESTGVGRGRSLETVPLQWRSQNEPPPARGDTGVFDVQLAGGWFRIDRVVEWNDRWANHRFVHPYNFVEFPEADVVEAARRQPLFQYRPSAPHDRYDAALCSGHIDCVLETLTDWFIPHAEKVHIEEKHKLLGYFTLDEVVAPWNPKVADTTRPAIPSSSLRGMIRSVFEAATLSCFSVFDDGRLDLRVGYSPGKPPGVRAASNYIPCRVIEVGEKEGWIQLLDSVLVPFYDPKVFAGGHAGTPTRLGCEAKAWEDGTRVAATLDRSHQPPRVTRMVRIADEQHPGPEEILDALKPQPGQVVFGYLHRTGPNIENKRHGASSTGATQRTTRA